MSSEEGAVLRRFLTQAAEEASWKVLLLPDVPDLRLDVTGDRLA